MSSNIVYDPFEQLERDELFDILTELRERAPVYQAAAGFLVVTRWEDVRRIQSDPSAFSSSANSEQANGMPTSGDPAHLEQMAAIMEGFPIDPEELLSARNLTAADPPDHTRIRRITGRGFTPRRISDLTETIDSIAAECLSGIETAESYEAVQRVAVPLPVRMIAALLGVDPDHVNDVKRWSDQYAEAALGPIRGTPEARLLAMDTYREFSTYFKPVIEARREVPQGDLISAMVQAVDSESLTTPEALINALLIMVAGNETSTNLIGNTIVALMENPDQLKLLQDSPALIPNAVEEANRFTTPIAFNFRQALEDVEVAGTVIPKDALVILQLAAANRDPRHFENPERFDITRPRGTNLAFGHGIHYCIGAHLAMQEASSAIRGMAASLSRFDLDSRHLERNPTMVLNGWKAIELVAH